MQLEYAYISTRVHPYVLYVGENEFCINPLVHEYGRANNDAISDVYRNNEPDCAGIVREINEDMCHARSEI